MATEVVGPAARRHRLRGRSSRSRRAMRRRASKGCCRTARTPAPNTPASSGRCRLGVNWRCWRYCRASLVGPPVPVRPTMAGRQAAHLGDPPRQGHVPGDSARSSPSILLDSFSDSGGALSGPQRLGNTTQRRQLNRPISARSGRTHNRIVTLLGTRVDSRHRQRLSASRLPCGTRKPGQTPKPARSRHRQRSATTATTPRRPQ